MPSVVHIATASDLPGSNQLGQSGSLVVVDAIFQNFHQGRASSGSGGKCIIWLARRRRRCSTSSAWAIPFASRSPRSACARQVKRPFIFVLAGVNSAGKSSVGGSLLQEHGMYWFNPDSYARELVARSKLDIESANASA